MLPVDPQIRRSEMSYAHDRDRDWRLPRIGRLTSTLLAIVAAVTTAFVSFTVQGSLAFVNCSLKQRVPSSASKVIDASDWWALGIWLGLAVVVPLALAMFGADRSFRGLGLALVIAGTAVIAFLAFEPMTDPVGYWTRERC